MKTQSDPTSTAKLILKYLKDELSAQEKQQFENWLNANPQNHQLVESFRSTSEVQKEINYINAIDVNEGWAAISNQIELKKHKPLFTKKLVRYGIAASLVFVLGFGIYAYQIKNRPTSTLTSNKSYDILPGSAKATLSLADGTLLNLNSSLTIKNNAIGVKDGIIAFNQINKQNSGYNLLKTPKAGEYQMILPDGTKVWLNAASSLKFPSSFNKGERRVELNGEAYFEVAHNKSIPFVVHFNHTDVEVLGTHFNINSYNAKSTTTLLEGSVKIKNGRTEKMLKPGDEATETSGQLAVYKTADTYKSIAWKEGVFYFNDDKITDILDQIARWYNVDVTYEGTPKNKTYSGNIRRQATLNQALEMLNAVSGAKFKLENRTITVNF